ncbi:hypothetical protein C5C67_05345 [Rathayibacter sp. AY1E1]|nr:hypothetical protein C5C67_05345 [Rathayibacter sp. AY1E1]
MCQPCAAAATMSARAAAAVAAWSPEAASTAACASCSAGVCPHTSLSTAGVVVVVRVSLSAESGGRAGTGGGGVAGDDRGERVVPGRELAEVSGGALISLAPRLLIRIRLLASENDGQRDEAGLRGVRLDERAESVGVEAGGLRDHEEGMREGVAAAHP